MSGYYYFSFHFVLRVDAPDAYTVLAAAASGQPPPGPALSRIHPVPRFFLADIERLLDDETEPRIGAPVRLAGATTGGSRLSIEFCMHDDLFANGGYLFWLWILSLVERPTPGTREVIGYEGLYRNDAGMGFTVATADGFVTRHGVTVDYDSIEAELNDWTTWDQWHS